MEHTPVLVTVRYSSSRLPGKCLLRVDGTTILEHLVARLTSADLVPVICTSTDPSDDVICNLAEEIGVQFVRGSLLNKVQRWSDAATFLQAKSLHIIDADDPLVDTDEIKMSLKKLFDLNLDLLRTSDRSDGGFASVGMSVRSDFLKLLAERTLELGNQDLDVIPWGLILKETDLVEKMPDNVHCPGEKQDLRLTLDYEEDFTLLSYLIDHLGNDSPRVLIEEFLFQNPELIKLNESRTVDFRTNKINQLKNNFNSN